MDAGTVYRNGSGVYVSFIKRRRSCLEKGAEEAFTVELCRTVFADNPGQMVYNVHKHNPDHYGISDIVGEQTRQEGLLC